jgi:hypothetical protein
VGFSPSAALSAEGLIALLFERREKRFMISLLRPHRPTVN